MVLLRLLVYFVFGGVFENSLSKIDSERLFESYKQSNVTGMSGVAIFLNLKAKLGFEVRTDKFAVAVKPNHDRN